MSRVRAEEIAAAFGISGEAAAKCAAVLDDYFNGGRGVDDTFYKIERIVNSDRPATTFGIESLLVDESGATDSNNASKFVRRFHYLNTGDTYSGTIVYSDDDDEFFVSTWGDVAEGALLEWAV